VNDEGARVRIADAEPEVVCICAFGALLQEPFLSQHEMLNVHPSLLPRWRGAAPVARAIERIHGPSLSAGSGRRRGRYAPRLVHPTVADCERVQAAWNLAISRAGGGESWEDAGLTWSWQAHDRQLILNFPHAIDAAAIRRGVDAGRDRAARIIGAWLAADVDASPLEAAGFERGWEPCWMATELTAIPACTDNRVSLTADVPEYGPDGQRLLTLAQGRDATAWHAVARVDGAFAGRAWSFATGPHAGVYDMDVWPIFRRRGLARALLRAVCRAARTAGAQFATLNATAEGEPLYAGEGFARLGQGITYWHHLR
jgi:GNAT superfamily N-acetyltransferase